MKVDYTTPIVEIKLNYLLVHSIINLENSIEEILRDIVRSSKGTEDINKYFNQNVVSINYEGDSYLSLLNIKISDLPYSSVHEIEDLLRTNAEIIEIFKTYDSFRIGENQSFLKELYNIEMKIREIYTTLTVLQGVNMKNSTAKLQKEYSKNADEFKARLMNEFFFMNFSEYKQVDRKRDTKLEDLLEALKEVKVLNEINDIVNELTHPTLHLEERFNELSNVPGAIGRLERFRNSIAHNRDISKTEFENFKKAKQIIDDVYNDFLRKFRENNL